MTKLKFKRPKGFVGSVPRKWADEKFPKCPFCNEYAEWNLATEYWTQRHHFKCSKCGAQLSTSRDVMIDYFGNKTNTPKLITKFDKIASSVFDKDGDKIKVEDVGDNVDFNYMIGNLYSVSELIESLNKGYI